MKESKRKLIQLVFATLVSLVAYLIYRESSFYEPSLGIVPICVPVIPVLLLQNSFFSAFVYSFLMVSSFLKYFEVIDKDILNLACIIFISFAIIRCQLAKAHPVGFSLAMHLPIIIACIWIINYLALELGDDYSSAIVASAVVLGIFGVFSIIGHLVALMEE